MTYINLRVAVTLGAVLFSANVQALIVLQQFSVPVGLDFDTNPTLSPTDKKSIMRFTASPRYSVAAVDEKNRWYSNVGLSIIRTTDKQITDDRQDPNINVGWTRELEKGSFSLTGAYNKSSSRFRELRTSGFVDGDGSSVTKSIAANWTTAITERLDYSAGVNLTKNNNSGATSLVASSVRKSFTTALTYALNPRVSPFIQYWYTKFEPKGLGSVKNNSQNYVAGVKYAYNPMLNLTMSAGISKLSTAGNGKLFNAVADYTGEHYTLLAALNRTVQPSERGNFEEADSFNVTYNYLLTEKSRFGLLFDWNKNKTADSSNLAGININTTGIRFGANYTKDITTDWQMRLSVEERINKSNNQRANAEIIGIVFTYNTPEF